MGSFLSWYQNYKCIVENGLKPGIHNAFGKGIYCTPEISTAEIYSSTFTSDTTKKQYKIVFQNRVNPKAIVYCGAKGGPEDYWYVEDEKDIRPYGICIKEIQSEIEKPKEEKKKIEEQNNSVNNVKSEKSDGCFIY